jgi:hypothetical protein
MDEVQWESPQLSLEWRQGSPCWDVQGVVGEGEWCVVWVVKVVSDKGMGYH